MVVFHTSFIRLLERVQQERWHDTPECLYHFFTVARVEDIIGSAGLVGCSFDKVERTLLQLVRAEQDGRVSWRSPIYTADGEKRRARHTLQKAVEMGAPVPYFPNEDSFIYDYIIHDPRYMRRFLGNAVRFGDDL